MNDTRIKTILSLYSKQQIFKIEDFLLSEIDDENLLETIDFVVSDDANKRRKFKEELYEGNQYDGIFLEGNQYLLSSSKGKVLIIDILSEQHGVNKKDTQVQFDEESFIEVITKKKDVLDWIANVK